MSDQRLKVHPVPRTKGQPRLKSEHEPLGRLADAIDGDGAEIVGRHGGERAVETADRGAGGADDDDIV